MSSVIDTNKTGTTPPSSPNLTGGGAIEISPFQPNESVGQSPPHNYRHSRAYRHFKNPPQPHMCIRTTTVLGDELFINVLSWTRIVIPQEPSDPIPLYGGMRVPPGSPRCPPLVYAVMANPEVLKDSGRHSKDPEERRAMVELMCDFVEAMNTDVKLTRNAVILKDRDISGELKDVWNAVQAQRDREREEQLSQQQRQQQQHYHNITTQQMFPKVSQQQQQIQNFETDTGTTMQETHNSKSNELPYSGENENESGSDNKFLYMDFSPETTPTTTSVSTILTTTIGNETKQLKSSDIQITSLNKPNEMGAQSAINSLANINFTFSDKDNNDKTLITTNLSNKLDESGKNEDVTDSTILENQPINNIKTNNQTTINTAINKVNTTATTPATHLNESKLNHNNAIASNLSGEMKPQSNIQSNNPTANNINNTTTTTSSNVGNTTAITINSITPIPTKKEKLGGFLPNGCIFPRFKNNKHKDKEKEKDKDKDKEKDNTKSSSNKEKTLLNSLKKVTSPSSKSHQQQQEIKSQQYDKNCINLENEVEKLDLNKLDTSGANDMLIKVKVASSGAK